MNYQVTYETTPNPDSMKFNLGSIFNEKPFECNHIKDTDASPLATKIFGFPWASQVFIGTDFITVKKQDWVHWEILAKPLAGLIQQHLESGEPIVNLISDSNSSDNSSNLDSISLKIKQLLENEIRPALASDGGDIDFISYADGILTVQLKGACNGCPSSSATLKNGIEKYLKEIIPDLILVQSI